ncbi:MAG: hypothetical protein JRG73_06580 [Deltaproteobacteria bacterium]|nr:hypothetical protein [Deltaproteobacteria bacterium]MBW2306588.1 hypothetical protein [Deltaproteobacteria bacterium]
MRANKVINRNYNGKFCLQPLKRFGETKGLSAQMSVHHSPSEVGSFHERRINGITVGVLQPSYNTILLTKDHGSLHFDHMSFRASFMDRGVIEIGIESGLLLDILLLRTFINSSACSNVRSPIM